MAHRLATIDIGTNPALLLVAERSEDGALRAVHDDCRFVRLGQGVDAAGVLSPEAIERTMAALRDFCAVIDDLGAERVGVVGTQALREAENGGAFLEPARSLLSKGRPEPVAIEVVSGDREAELTFRAVSESLPELAGAELTVADVGGGSTEVVTGRDGVVRSRRSVAIGSVRLTERHLRGDPVTPDEARALYAAIDRALAEVDLPADGRTLVGVAGTATTLAAVELRLEPYDGDRVHGMRLPAPVVERQLARYLELTVEERRRLPGLPPARADVIAAGAAVFARLLHQMRAPALVVSDRGVRWGLAYELAAAFPLP